LEKQKAPVSSSLYTEEYFRTACEGFDVFNTSEGEQLSRRLSSAFALAEITPGMIVLDVGLRDSAFFSVIDSEWPQVRANLERRLGRPRSAAG
jgi:hypothetical protein